jgi:Fe-S cluster biogenesis protein NfuA/nitrite reductase/ring-hydroxylating ferredoxin subunit
MTQENRDLQKQMQKIGELVAKIESMADSAAKTSARELVQSLMDLHGRGIERMLDIVAEAETQKIELIDELARDQLVSSLLLLYGLHPVEMESRVMQALDKVRPYLQSHGGNVDLLAVEDGLVRLRLEGSCHGCASSALTLKLAIEEAIYEAAPDVTALSVEGVVEQRSSGLVTLQRKTSDNDFERWTEVAGLEHLVQGAALTLEVRGRPVLFCKLQENLYAYSSTCRGCGQPLAGARVETIALVCPACGLRYDVSRAGRGVDQPDVFLDPFPLLVEQGIARVALPA